MDVHYLKLMCYKNNKDYLLRWVEKYCSMTDRERMNEKCRIVAKRFNEIDWDGKRSLLERIKGFFKMRNTKEDEDNKWIEAFEFFEEETEKFMGDVHEMMGLPRSGIRPDDC